MWCFIQGAWGQKAGDVSSLLCFGFLRLRGGFVFLARFYEEIVGVIPVRNGFFL